MDESLTAVDAQLKIRSYMSELLAELPTGTALSKKPDNPDLATKNRRNPIANPCWEGNVQSDGPRYLSIGYWIVGLPAGSTTEYFERIPELWQSKGWATEPQGRTVVKAKIPDGFGFQLQDAGKGDGSLSLTGFSPCVPEATIDAMENDPFTITQP
ncbi:hypothetical protein BOX37_08580 [Nocardia mangyaensis]|uniref:Uncharacterized protein n=1 Tax=Nocardia mangyaensis TaxID=2213200 RepID=A0A1J0VPR2_9NOCA|nr:hypothetical protein [Nocardia mangyaensis]APE34019.1 hypothetical protein BOX37_08580 [Nocardia mangyaensis]